MNYDGEPREDYPHRLFDDMDQDRDDDIVAFRLWARENARLGSSIDHFAEFMARRFPHHAPSQDEDGEWQADSYTEQWADRFKTGKPHRYMDGKSLVAYNEATNMLKQADTIRKAYREVIYE